MNCVVAAWTSSSRRAAGQGWGVLWTHPHWIGCDGKREERRTASGFASATRELFVLTRTAEQFAATVNGWIAARRRPRSGAKPRSRCASRGGVLRLRGCAWLSRGGRGGAGAVGCRRGAGDTTRDQAGGTGLLRQVGTCAPDVVLVRNLAALEFFRDGGVETRAKSAGESPRLRGDYSLNVVNELTADLFRGEGLESITTGTT